MSNRRCRKASTRTVILPGNLRLDSRSSHPGGGIVQLFVLVVLGRSTGVSGSAWR